MGSERRPYRRTAEYPIMASALLPQFTSIQPYAFDSAMRAHHAAAFAQASQHPESLPPHARQRGLERPMVPRWRLCNRIPRLRARSSALLVHRVVSVECRIGMSIAVHAIRAQRVLRTHHGDQTESMPPD